MHYIFWYYYEEPIYLFLIIFFFQIHYITTIDGNIASLVHYYNELYAKRFAFYAFTICACKPFSDPMDASFCIDECGRWSHKIDVAFRSRFVISLLTPSKKNTEKGSFWPNSSNINTKDTKLLSEFKRVYNREYIPNMWCYFEFHFIKLENKI